MSADPTMSGVVAERLLSHLSARGVVFTVEGGALRFKAPRGSVNAEGVAAVREHKGELIALLAPPATLTWEELVAKMGREPDARCACGARADHLTRAGIWQCGRCAGFPEPEPEPMSAEMAEACAAYDRLRGELLDLTGHLVRARDAGEAAEVARLQEALSPMRRAYYEAGAVLAGLADTPNSGEMQRKVDRL